MIDLDYNHSNSRACPCAGAFEVAFEVAFEAAFEKEAWVKVVRCVEGLIEDLTGLQAVRHFAHLVSVDRCHLASVGCIGEIEEDPRWDHCLVVVSSNR